MKVLAAAVQTKLNMQKRQEFCRGQANSDVVGELTL